MNAFTIRILQIELQEDMHEQSADEFLDQFPSLSHDHILLLALFLHHCLCDQLPIDLACRCLWNARGESNLLTSDISLAVNSKGNIQDWCQKPQGAREFTFFGTLCAAILSRTHFWRSFFSTSDPSCRQTAAPTS